MGRGYAGDALRLHVRLPADDRHGPPLVLIVDDNEKNLKLARDVLRAAGFRTLEAASGAEAIALAAEHLPDVILMDLRLPDMDGTDAAQTLRSASADGVDPGRRAERAAARGRRRLALAAGFAGYLEKPIDVGEFPGPGAPLLRGRRCRQRATDEPCVERCASTPPRGRQAWLARRLARHSLAAWTLDTSRNM